jgi:hypothetical protein
MKKVIAIGMLMLTLVGLVPATAQAGAATNAALGLGAFALFSQLLGGVGIFGARRVYAAPAYYPAYYSYPAPVYAAPPVTYYAPPATTYAPAPSAQTEVVYPHGKYVLTGDGVTVAYLWVWVANPPPAPPAPPEGK